MPEDPTPAATNADKIKELVAAHTEAVQNGGVVSPRLKGAVNALSAGLEPEPPPAPPVAPVVETPPPVDQVPGNPPAAEVPGAGTELAPA